MSKPSGATSPVIENVGIDVGQAEHGSCRERASPHCARAMPTIVRTTWNRIAIWTAATR